ncbi:hypothetical protein QUB36_14800 [Microcoleus sp. AT8-B1]|uniref:hypothetical protein n=1 Tax=unclassified Microcoleus TaxID=2642155 RepID=UPI002FD6A0C3
MPSDIQPKSFVDKDFSIIVKNFCLFENLRKLNKISELAIALHLPRLANGQAGDRTNTLLMLNFYDFCFFTRLSYTQVLFAIVKFV